MQVKGISAKRHLEGERKKERSPLLRRKDSDKPSHGSSKLSKHKESASSLKYMRKNNNSSSKRSLNDHSALEVRKQNLDPVENERILSSTSKSESKCGVFP